MKLKLLTIVCISCIIFSCHSNENETKEVPEETVSDTLTATGDSTRTVINHPQIWTVDQGKTGKEKLRKPEDVKLDTFSSAHLVELINNNFPEIHLDLEKISHDTAYVNIPDSKRLTQEIGSTGAESYMASATYTLTELKNIRYVNFSMKEGDHAGPGVFSREDFKRFR